MEQMNIASFALKTCLHNRKFKMLLLLSENKFEKGKVLHIETNLVKQRESLPKIYIASHKTISRGLATNFLRISGQLDFLMAIQFHFLYCYCFYFRGNIEGQFFYMHLILRYVWLGVSFQCYSCFQKMKMKHFTTYSWICRWQWTKKRSNLKINV